MFKRIFISIIVALLGAVFIFSGYIKLFPIEPFEMNFVEQGFFNWTLAPFVARFLIAFEIFLGFMLLFQQRLRFTLKAVVALLVFFTLYLIYAIIKDGNTGNCGCFGTYLQMTPLQSIIKNIAMLATALLLLKIKFHKKYSNKWITLLFIAGAIAVPFVINPPDLFVIETYEFGKLNYPLKGEKLDTFKTQGIDADWKKGKKIIAFLSLTCSHCRDMAFKLHILKKNEPSLNILFVYGGAAANKKNFLNKAMCADIPSIDLTLDEMVKISGPYFPTVVGLNDGMVVKKWTIVTMNEKELQLFFKN